MYWVVRSSPPPTFRRVRVSFFSFHWYIFAIRSSRTPGGDGEVRVLERLFGRRRAAHVDQALVRGSTRSAPIETTAFSPSARLRAVRTARPSFQNSTTNEARNMSRPIGIPTIDPTIRDHHPCEETSV